MASFFKTFAVVALFGVVLARSPHADMIPSPIVGAHCTMSHDRSASVLLFEAPDGSEEAGQSICSAFSFDLYASTGVKTFCHNGLVELDNIEDCHLLVNKLNVPKMSCVPTLGGTTILQFPDQDACALFTRSVLRRLNGMATDSMMV